MNFIKFPVDSTDIFPIANTVNGGQLVTEFNLRSRESVYSDSSVQYMIGPSFTHSGSDFEVTLSASGGGNYFPDQSELSGGVGSSGVLQISSGRAVVNGHFVALHSDITIDMISASEDAAHSGESALEGELCVGLRAMYSSELNISGSILTENGQGLYEGIQVVILPKAEFILPEDSPTDQSQIKAHLLLATFNYANGNITRIVNNPEKCAMLGSDRIKAIDSILSKNYPSKANLDPMKFYTLGGKFDMTTSEPEWVMDWCDATGSTMVWDAEIHTMNTQPTLNGVVLRSAQFAVDNNNRQISLVIPHKQIDGMANGSANGSNQPKFFVPAVLPLPVADLDSGTPGTVDSNYSDAIIRHAVNKIYQTENITNGKQKLYMTELSDRGYLPTIGSGWSIGDYVLVGQDYTIQYTLADSSRKPSTLYAIVPGIVLKLKFQSATSAIPKFAGVELARKIWHTDDPIPSRDDPDVFNTYWNLSNYHGEPNADYFVYEYTNNGVTQYYCYLVKESSNNEYSDPILVTGGVPLAEEETVGGFLNVPDTAVDGGYVRLDSKGYLRLVDYNLLRSGALAYQLGEDYSVPEGLTIAEIQNYLDEYVNERVAFPNDGQLESSDPNRIHVYVKITDTQTENGTLSFYNIDSRFNTSVCLHITYAEGVKCTINISDCERIQLHTDILRNSAMADVSVNIYRSGLYYNNEIFDFVDSMKDITLWYNRYEESDPQLTVDGMTVSQITIGSAYSDNNIEAITNWSTINVNDNHFAVALHSITFNASGNVCGCEVYVRNNSATMQSGKYVIRDSISLPQGPDLLYPTSRMKNAINITGQFVSAYMNGSNLNVQDTKFSMMTQVYQYKDIISAKGDIAFLIDAYAVPVTFGTQVSEWNPTTFHCFGGQIMN